MTGKYTTILIAVFVLISTLGVGVTPTLAQSTTTQADAPSEITASDLSDAEIRTMIKYPPQTFKDPVIEAAANNIYNSSMENYTQKEADLAGIWLADAMAHLDDRQTTGDYPRSTNTPNDLYDFNSENIPTELQDTTTTPTTTTPTTTTPATTQQAPDGEQNSTTTAPTTTRQTTTNSNDPNQTTTNNSTGQNNPTNGDSGTPDFGEVKKSGSKTTQNMMISTDHTSDANLNGTTAKQLAQGVYETDFSYNDGGGATIDIYSERKVTVTVTWAVPGGAESQAVQLNPGLNTLNINAATGGGSIAVPTGQGYSEVEEYDQQGYTIPIQTITVKHLLSVIVVILGGSLGMMFWLSNWFQRNVLNEYHKLSESDLLKIFKH